MAIRTSQIALRWRWLIAMTLAFVLISLEVMEHRPSSFTDMDSDFVREIGLFGVLFPATFGVALGRLPRYAPAADRESAVIGLAGSVATEARRVFMVENVTLLGAGVQSLLVSEADLEVAGSMPEDEVDLWAELDDFQPHVVILDETTTEKSRLCSLLQRYPELQILVISTEDDLVRIYSKRQELVTGADDFIRIVRRRASTCERKQRKLAIADEKRSQATC